MVAMVPAAEVADIQQPALVAKVVAGTVEKQVGLQGVVAVAPAWADGLVAAARRLPLALAEAAAASRAESLVAHVAVVGAVEALAVAQGGAVRKRRQAEEAVVEVALAAWQGGGPVLRAACAVVPEQLVEAAHTQPEVEEAAAVAATAAAWAVQRAMGRAAMGVAVKLVAAAHTALLEQVEAAAEDATAEWQAKDTSEAC